MIDNGPIAAAMKREFCSIIEEYAQKPFSETGVTIPPDDIWLRYAGAAIKELEALLKAKGE